MLHGRKRKAPRAAWLLLVGPIPGGLLVLHNCDNPPCVNPGHLRLGTHKDNAHDRDVRGRRSSYVPAPRRGAEHHLAKLNEDQVREILARLQRGETPKQIADDFPVGRNLITEIKHGRAWRHVTEATGYWAAGFTTGAHELDF
jgi:hypothetical protein